MNMTFRGIHDHIDQGFRRSVLLSKREDRGIYGEEKGLV